MTRAELNEMAESFHALAQQAEAIEANDAETYTRAILAWQQVAERLCVIDYSLAMAFPAMAPLSETVH